MSKPKPTATTTPREALHALLQELNFKGMARVLDSELDRAERNGVSCAELVQRLLGEQASFQRERSLANRVQHHCITIRIEGPSLRTNPPAKKTQPPDQKSKPSDKAA